MSASLVGSEMCIRDSPARCPGCAGAAAACEGGACPEACEHHAGDAGGARPRGELPEVPPGPGSAPSGGYPPLGRAPRA
eukprot:11176896-Alexandrium_andersonii.AAC.1